MTLGSSIPSKPARLGTTIGEVAHAKTGLSHAAAAGVKYRIFKARRGVRISASQSADVASTSAQRGSHPARDQQRCPIERFGDSDKTRDGRRRGYGGREGSAL